MVVLVAGGVYFIREIGRTEIAEKSDSEQSKGSALGAGRVQGTNIADQVQAMLRSSDFARAAQTLQQQFDSSSASGENQSLRVLMAQARIGLSDFKGAYEQYEMAIAIAGASASVRANEQGGVQRDPTAAQLHFEAGTCAVQAGLGDRAIEHYSTAQTLDPGESKYPLYLGMVQAKMGADDEAVASLIRATRLKPELGEAWGTMGEIELRRNHAGLALQHAERARQLQPNVVKWRLVEARALNRKGDADKALALLNALDETSRGEKSVMSLTAESYGLLKRPGDAAAMYAKAADANPSDSELNYQASIWCDRIGENARARRYAELAATLGHHGARSLLEKYAGASSPSRD